MISSCNGALVKLNRWHISNKRVCAHFQPWWSFLLFFRLCCVRYIHARALTHCTQQVCTRPLLAPACDCRASEAVDKTWSIFRSLVLLLTAVTDSVGRCRRADHTLRRKKLNSYEMRVYDPFAKYDPPLSLQPTSCRNPHNPGPVQLTVKWVLLTLLSIHLKTPHKAMCRTQSVLSPIAF